MSLEQAQKRLIAARAKHDEVAKAYDSIGKKYTAIAQNYFRATSELHEAKRGFDLALTTQGNDIILKQPKCHTENDEQTATLEKAKKASPVQPTAWRGKRKIGGAECSTASDQPKATPAEHSGNKKIAAAAFVISTKNTASQPTMPVPKRKRRAVSPVSTTSTPAVHLDGTGKAFGYKDQTTFTPYPVKTHAKSMEHRGKRVRSPKKRFPCECA